MSEDTKSEEEVVFGLSRAEWRVALQIGPTKEQYRRIREWADAHPGASPPEGPYFSMLDDNLTEPINPSGIVPTGFNVLIRPEKVGDKIGSIYIPEQERDKQQFATTRGTIIAVSPVAFTYIERERWADVGSSPPKVGDIVVFKRYSGVEVEGNDKGEDGKAVKYFLVPDQEVYAVVKT